jgi:Predicted transcriptional regulators containing the CopG/Arc/MetJ DNA-binding domain and a metal-binding domain
MTQQKAQRIQILLTDTVVSDLDGLVEKGHFINRQDAIRSLLKNGIESYEDIENPSVLKNETNHYEGEVSE